MKASIACPHCQSPAQVRTSRAITRMYRQLHLACTNIECGHTFAAELTVTHTISPSAMPDPSIHLRSAPPRRRADNDNRASQPLPTTQPANDDELIGDVSIQL